MSLVMKELRKEFGDRYVSSDPKVGYPTGFLELDYRNGKIIETKDLKTGEIYKYESLGIQGGSLITVVGPSGVAKTGLVTQIAAYIASKFEDSDIHHLDIEGAMDDARFKNLTGWTDQMIEDKYHLCSEELGHDAVTQYVQEIYDIKMKNKKNLIYNTGMKNKHGQDIYVMQPTFVILDSLASLVPEQLREDIKKNKELKNTSRFPMEVAKANAQLVKYMTPLLKTANIIFICINHVADNVSMEVIKKQAFLNYMKHDKNIPGGTAFQYYSNTLWAMFPNSNDKMKSDDDDAFDGFGVKLDIVKSRANKAGQSAIIPYSQTNGFNRTYHIYHMLDRHGYIKGSRKPSYYLEECPDIKFYYGNFIEKFNAEPELRKTSMSILRPILQGMLSKLDERLIDQYDMNELMWANRKKYIFDIHF